MNKGLYRLESDTLFPIVTGYLTEKCDILFSLPYNSSQVVVGTSDGKLSLFDGIKYYDYPVKDDGYLRDNIVSDGIAIGDSLYAFSTLDGGALVIEKLTGKIRFTINNQISLPDDEIYAIGLDNSGGLWLSHQYGLTRADLNLPVQNFSIFPGLSGNLTTSLWHNGELYVATSEGVFYLTQVRNYTEVAVQTRQEPEKSTPAAAQQQAGKKGLFSKIFGKKVATEKAASPATTGKVQTAQAAPAVQKTVSKLKSINYVFKKVDGFKDKCRQLVSTRYGILAASNKGLYAINNHSASLVGENRYINTISLQPVDEKFNIATTDGYFSVKNIGGRWITEVPNPDFTEPVYSVIRTSDMTTWLGVDNAAVRIDPNGAASDKFKRVSIKNDYPQRYILDLINDSVYLFSESGIYFYDKNSNTFLRSGKDKVEEGETQKYYYPLSNQPWVRKDEEWKFLSNNDKNIEKQASLYKLFNDVISINTDRNILWVVDGENRLFRIDISKTSKITPEIDIFIKSIYNDSGTSFDLSNIVFNRGDNIVNFDIVAPGYLKQNTTQYQYTISKLMPEWSPWSSRTSYNLMIPVAGDYTLQIRAKDLWGNIGKAETIKFTIKSSIYKNNIILCPCYYYNSYNVVLYCAVQRRSVTEGE